MEYLFCQCVCQCPAVTGLGVPSYIHVFKRELKGMDILAIYICWEAGSKCLNYGCGSLYSDKRLPASLTQIKRT